MKTITEYGPMIFSQIESHTAKRIGQRRQFFWDATMVAAYCALGLWLFWDTGFAPWDWQFWITFGPVLTAGELACQQFVRDDE